MRRLMASASFMLLLIAGNAFAFLDAGLDASVLDAGTDAIATDAASDAPSEVGTDAAAESSVDAAPDASDASAIKDAKSDVCNPNVEPCTGRADTGPDTDAGDTEEPTGTTGGCSCNSAPAALSTAPIAFLLVAFALLSRRRKR